MNTFAKGQKLSTSSICDSECIFTADVISRTAKTVTIKEYSEEKRVKVHTDEDGNEYCYPHGRHSMCAIFRAPAAEEAAPEPTAPKTQTIADEEHEIVESESLVVGDTVWCNHVDKDYNIYTSGLITNIRSTFTGIVIDVHTMSDEIQSLRADNFTISVLKPASRTVYIAKYASNAFADKRFNTQEEAEQAIQDTYDGVNLTSDATEESREYWKQQALNMVIVREEIQITNVITPTIKK